MNLRIERSRILKSDKPDELRAALERQEDELSAVAAFYRLVDLQQMSPRVAAGIRSKSDRLRRVVLQYLAYEKSLSKANDVGVDTKRVPSRKPQGVKTRGVLDRPESHKVLDWRELAEADPAPAIRRLALLGD